MKTPAGGWNELEEQDRGYTGLGKELAVARNGVCQRWGWWWSGSERNPLNGLKFALHKLSEESYRLSYSLFFFNLFHLLTLERGRKGERETWTG